MPQLRTSIALSLVLAGAATLGTAAAAAAAPESRAATPSAQDTAFVLSNAQSNLAEISLGQLGAQRGQDAATKTLAAVTLADHTKLQAGLAAVAQADGLTLPTTPNAMQVATAKQLMATSTQAFDLAYAQAEVMGHQLAIAAANTETSAGSAADLKNYATGYIPIATGHLNMATSEVSALSGSAPTSVSAGSGGRAVTDTSDETPLVAGIVGALVLAAGSGLALMRRRRTA